MTTQEILEAARGAKTAVALSDSGTRDSALLGMADALCAPESMDAILAANAEDMAAAKGRISDVMLDRDRKSTRLNSSHANESRMPSSA